MGKKHITDASLSQGKLGFAASGNNSWYVTTETGEQRDVLRTGQFTPLSTPFKRSAALLDPFDKSLNTAKTGERYTYMTSCPDILHRDFPLRYTQQAAPETGAFNVLPRPQYATESGANGGRKSSNFALPISATITFSKGVSQQGASTADRFSVRVLS